MNQALTAPALEIAVVPHRPIEHRECSGKRLIFVGGAARSGTTLVQNILDCHPDIYGSPVFAHVPEIVSLRNTLRAAVGLGWIESFCSQSEVDLRIAELLEDLLLPAAIRSGCRLMSEKTTANVMVFAELMEILPQARFIRVVRDPRAVVSSLLQVGIRARRNGRSAPAFTQSFAAALSHAIERFDAGCRAAELPGRRLHTVVYEQLVSDPRMQVRALCRFLNLEWCEDMMFPSRKTHPGEKNIVDSIWYEKREHYYRDPEPTEIGAWRQRLNSIQQARIAAAFLGDPRLAELGYHIKYGALDRLRNSLGAMCEMVARLRRTTGRAEGFPRCSCGPIGA